MTGRNLVMFLKSPLFQFKYEREGQKVMLARDLVQLKGEVVKEKGAGIWLRVEAMGANDLSITEDLPFKEIFVPFAKIDYMVFE
jgi:hypothetical protein